MPLYLHLLAPVLAGVVTLAAAPWVRRGATPWGVGLAVLALAGAAWSVHAAMTGGAVTFSVPWVEPMDVAFALRLDPFRALFLAIIWLMAGAVLLHTGGAMPKDGRVASLMASLLFFAAAMAGVVLSDDFILLFLSWEATSLLSFVLVGWHHADPDARRKATQALLVTGLGGLALLAGLLLLKEAAGTTTFTGLGQADLSAHPLAPWIILLVAAGALTKSAQFPFHFWLPNAMAGPTPVSAFLHSATMVKAGVFLLALLAPNFSAHPWWTPLLVTAGLLTVVLAVLRGWRAADLKVIFAATTLAALGHLTVLAGVGTPAAIQAFVLFLLAHALYKGCLFLAGGTLEKSFGTRDPRRMRGSVFAAPATGMALAVSLGSLVGIFPLPGFAAKEYFLKGIWSSGPWLAAAAALSFAGLVAMSLRTLAPLFSRGDVARPAKRPPAAVAAAPWLPAAGTVILTLGFAWWSPALLVPAAESASTAATAPFKIWPGVGPPLFLSLAALGGGIAAAWTAGVLRPGRESTGIPFADRCYELAFDGVGRLGAAVDRLLQNRPLATHLGVIVGAAGILVLWLLANGTLLLPPFSFTAADTVSAVLAVLLALAAVAAARARAGVEMIIFLGLTGLLVALFFSYFSAPDLALTQLLTETVLLVLLVTVLRLWAKRDGRRRAKDSRPRFALPVAVAGGVATTALLLKAKAIELTEPVSGFFTANSLEKAYGANVVNVILVDFRALDTLGEITVLAVAAAGAMALIHRHAPPLAFDPARSSLLTTARRLMLPALAVLAVFFFLRGHNEPGGGFIAALVAAVAAAWLALTGKQPRHPRLDRHLIAGGLVLSVASGLAALPAGREFLTGLWLHFDLPGDGKPLHLGTPLLFDAGVSLTVLGFALAYLRRLFAAPGPAHTAD